MHRRSVLTLRSAATLLAASTSVPSLGPLAAAIGCDGTPAPLDDDATRILGIPSSFRRAHVATGTGSLRALLLELRGNALLREEIGRVAARLTARAPHLLWLVIAVDPARAQLAIATWSPDRTPPRVAALLVDRDRIVDSDAETVRALAAAHDHADVLTHARWLDVLGRDALTRRFYRELRRMLEALADSVSAVDRRARREIALLYLSRLLFLSFLEAKGWLDGDRAFLLNQFERSAAAGGGYHRRVLRPLFFGTLNTPRRRRAPRALAFGRVPFLNGGLFAHTPVERRCRTLVFPDEVLGAVHGELLSRYRFTAREDQSSWSEAAVDPEMLGKAFESLMSGDARRDGGAFYTPQVIVEELTTRALRAALAPDGASGAGVERLLEGEPVTAAAADAMRRRLVSLRLLDPACGSGAFLVHALERLAALGARLGDRRPIAEIRRDVLTRSIFGVDLDPTAVWLCELRLWLSVVIESEPADIDAIVPLPNLDHHIRVGDTLRGPGFELAAVDGPAPRSIAVLRERYARSVGGRKAQLARTLAREERRQAVRACELALDIAAARRRDLLAARRTRDLFGERQHPAAAERLQLELLRSEARALRAERCRLRERGALPFSFPSHFADAAAAGGFDGVLGNPPWVRLHRIPPALRSELRRRYEVFRNAAWREGAAAAHAGPGFAAQADLAAIFVERSLSLVRPGGTVALLLPGKLWRSLAGGGVRQLLTTRAELRSLEDWSEAPASFEASVYPSLLVARRICAPGGPLHPRDDAEHGEAPLAVTVRHRDCADRWTARPHELPLDETAGSPWLLLPPDVRRAFDLVRQAGPPLGASGLGRPTLGLKCGLNAAYLVDLLDRRAETAQIASGERRGEVEWALLRPVLRGDDLRPWAHAASGHIVYPHDGAGDVLPGLPPHAARWLGRWRHRLVRRSDVRGRTRWWTLFRTEAALSDRPRVVWADIGRAPRASVLFAGDPTVPINSCYVIRSADACDALAIAALLNSELATAWLSCITEPARGGYRRFMGWSVALLPTPRDWERARTTLAPLARDALVAPPDAGGRAALEAAVLDCYALAPAQVAPLIAWSAR